jgi:hypothetical protein
VTEQTKAEQKKPGRKLIPGTPDLDEGELEAIKAIKSYETLEKKIALLDSEHSEFLKTREGYLEELERKRQVADAAIRAIDASFGPWERFSEQKTYDINGLYSLIGEDKFIELGGTVSQLPVYDLERDTLEVAIAAKKIPKSVVENILKITPKYRAPKPRGRA